MTNPFGTCMKVLDDLDPAGQMATGLTPLIQSVYHLIITERGTMPTNGEYGFGLTDVILSAYGPDELPAIADQIEAQLSEDDRIKEASVSIDIVDSVAVMTVVVLANTEPPTGFRLVGPLSDLKAEIIADTQRLLDA